MLFIEEVEYERQRVQVETIILSNCFKFILITNQEK